MLSKEENEFVGYWEMNREKEKNIYRQLFFGLPFGLLLGIGIILLFVSGWYQRAVMVAYVQSTPYVLIISIIAISVFTGVFYKKFKWERNEQHYRELLVKKRRENNNIT